jgi:SH3-like domain-containing protein
LAKWIFLLLSWQAHAGDPVCAKTAMTLRKNPSGSSAVSWRVPKYMPFMRQSDRKHGFVRVEDLEGESYWAKNSELTNRFRCVVVKTNVAVLRSEPSKTAPPADLKTVDRYTPLKRIGNDREWMQVEDETGRKAWIHESQVWKPVNIQSISF